MKKGYVMKWKLIEFTYHGDRVSACRVCEVSVTARCELESLVCVVRCCMAGDFFNS